MTKKTCKDCQFYYDMHNETGECVSMPPKVSDFLLTTSGDIEEATISPIIAGSRPACSLFQAVGESC